MSGETILNADEFLALPQAERTRRLGLLPLEDFERLMFDWDFWARKNQRLPGNVNTRTPDGTWQVWFIDAGRGFGKTRVGGETVRQWIKQGFRYVNLAGATASDARDIMIEGESGILAICPKDERPVYRKAEAKLIWPNGAVSLIFTADEPDRARGKQSSKLWADELAAWRYRDAWDQLMFGLRLGENPQAIVTTTPKPTDLVKELLKDPTTFVTHGSTYDNKRNLAKQFFQRIIKKYEGTRLGRQELNAELLEDNPNAVFHQDLIDRDRLPSMMLPKDLARIVVGVDPAVSSNEKSDETGIITVASDCQNPPHFYVMSDNSAASATPNEWAMAAVNAYKARSCDAIIGEINNGGEMVGYTVSTVDPNVKFKAVRATRGKVVRAEPIGALYEQGRVHHVGYFAMLETQMTGFDPATETEEHNDRMDALVWALTELSDPDNTYQAPLTVSIRRRGM